MSNSRFPKGFFSASILAAPIAVACTLFMLPMTAFAAPDRVQFRDFRAQNPGIDRATLRANFHALNRGNSHQNSSRPQQSSAGALRHTNAANVRVNFHDNRMMRSFQQNAAGDLVRLNSGIDIDFNSQDRNITLGDRLFAHTSSVKINVGGQEKTVSAGDQVTAAEYAAVKQVLVGGTQQIAVDGQGRASGGEVDLSAIAATKRDRLNVQDLSISDNLSVYGDFGRSSKFQVSGDLVNAGSIFVYSSRNGARSGLISADNITNKDGALITSALSEGASSSRRAIDGPTDLTLRANDTLSNSGTITVSGDLNVEAPKIVNHGLMQSSANVTLDSPVQLNVDNRGGTISAADGSISIRDRGYNDTFNTTVIGGDLRSKTLDVHCGNGTADFNVNSVSGILNETGFASHVSVSEDVLNLGDICLTGDPTYKNANGSINLNGSIFVQEALAIIASGNITNTTKLTINAGNTSTGFPITLIAGAEFATAAGVNYPDLGPIPPDPGGVSTSITGVGSTTGGSIFLGTGAGGAVTISSRATNKTGSSNAADILMVAYLGGGTTRGQINLTGSTTNSSGKGAGSNGNVRILANGGPTTSPNGKAIEGIETGTIIATNGGSGANGNIDIRAIRPVSSDMNDIVFNSSGVITSGNTIEAGSVVPNGTRILVNGDITARNSIIMRCGGASTVSVIIGKGATVSTSSPTGTILLGGSFGAGVRSEAGSLVSTNTLTLQTTEGDFGAAGAPLLVNAPNLIINSDNTSTDCFIFDKANFVVVDCEATSLNLLATNTITNLDGAPLQVFDLVLESLSGSLGFSNGAPMEVSSSNVTLNAGQNVFVHNTFAFPMTLKGSNSAGGTFSLRADDGFLAGALTEVSAKRITLNADGPFIVGTNPELHATERIDVISNGSIQNTNFGTVNTTTPLINFQLLSGSLGTMAKHYTSGVGVKAISVDIVSGDAFLGDSGTTKGFQLAGGSASGLYDYLGTGKTTVTKNVAAQAINLVTAAGTLAVAPNVELDATAFILARVLDNNPATNKKAKIVLGKNSTFETHANVSPFGSIVFTVGATPGAPIAGTPPAKAVGFATSGTGKIFWGQQGITAKTPINTVYAKDVDIVFNNTISAKNISLGGGVKIIGE